MTRDQAWAGDMKNLESAANRQTKTKTKEKEQEFVDSQTRGRGSPQDCYVGRGVKHKGTLTNEREIQHPDGAVETVKVHVCESAWPVLAEVLQRSGMGKAF